MTLITFLKQFCEKSKPFALCTWVALSVSFVAMLISLRVLPDNPTWSFLQIVYYIAYIFGKNFIICYLLEFVLALPFLLLNWKKTAYAIMVGINGLWLVFLLANSFVYNQFRMGINLAMLQFTFLSSGEVVIFSTTMKIWIAVLALACFAVTAGAVYLSTRLIKKSFRTGLFALIPIVFFVAGNLIYTVAFAFNSTSILMVHERIPIDYPLHMNRLFVKLGLLKREDIKKSQVEFKNAGTFHYPLHPIACQRPAKPYNVVLVFVDALRADMLNDDVMPLTNRFAKDQLVFDSHYSGGNSTRAAIFSVFYGLPSSYWHAALSAGTPSVISKSFVDAGYSLQAFTGAGLTSPEFNRTVFSNVNNLRTPPPGDVIFRDRAAINDFDQWVDHQTQQNKPFFGFLFLDNVHAYDFPQEPSAEKFKPYWKEVNQLSLGPDFDRTPYFNRYKNAAHWADKNIAHVIDGLKNRGLLDQTIVVISSDHGEEFNDNGGNYWGHNGNFTKAQIHVPLVVHWPGKSKGVVHYQTTSHDFAPTLLQDVLQCHNPVSDYSVGYNLFSEKNRKPWFHSGGYSVNAFVLPERILLINRLGMLEFKTPRYEESDDHSVPSFLSQAIEMMHRYFK